MMSKRLFWIVVALVAMGCVTAAWVQAETVRDGATLAGALAQAPQQQPTIPAPPDYVTASLDVLPLQFCPGYKLTYTFRLTNTSESEVVAQLTVRDDLPANTWFNTDEANTDISGSIPGAYHQYYDEDEEVWHRWVEWQGTNIGPGEVVIARVVLHPFTTWQNGAVLRNTFAYVVDGFRREEWAESTANRTLCAALPTLTPTFTPTNTPTATATVTPSATATATPSPTETLTPRHIVVLPLLWRSVAF